MIEIVLTFIQVINGVHATYKVSIRVAMILHDARYVSDTMAVESFSINDAF